MTHGGESRDSSYANMLQRIIRQGSVLNQSLRDKTNKEEKILLEVLLVPKGELVKQICQALPSSLP